MDDDDRVARIKEAEHVTGLAAPTIYEKMRKGEFPKSFFLGTGRAKGWLLSELRAWVKYHADQR